MEENISKNQRDRHLFADLINTRAKDLRDTKNSQDASVAMALNSVFMAFSLASYAPSKPPPEWASIMDYLGYSRLPDETMKDAKSELSRYYSIAFSPTKLGQPG